MCQKWACFYNLLLPSKGIQILRVFYELGDRYEPTQGQQKLSTRMEERRLCKNVGAFWGSRVGAGRQECVEVRSAKASRSVKEFWAWNKGDLWTHPVPKSLTMWISQQVEIWEKSSLESDCLESVSKTSLNCVFAFPSFFPLISELVDFSQIWCSLLFLCSYYHPLP